MMSTWILQLVIYSICYLASITLSYFGLYIVSGIVLAAAALYLYICAYKETGNPIDLKALFSLFFIGGQSLSCLKLSLLQRDWQPLTWLSFFCGYLFFALGYRWYCQHRMQVFQPKKRDYQFQEQRLLVLIVFITFVSLGCFLFEAYILGFIPLFSAEPHAYSYFHISGVHYFTVTFVLVPPLSVIWWCQSKNRSIAAGLLLMISNIIALVIPLLLVSRFQLLTMVLLAALAFLSGLNEVGIKKVLKYSALLVICLIPIYFYLTIRRNHDVEYLNSIFEMKSSKIPIFITQPYMYIANNYDNFNCLVEELPGHTFGLRMLFPLWALTGLKFKFPQLVNLPFYINKAELTTLTLFYDAYYDFGILGVGIFGGICGILCGWVRALAKKSKNPVAHVIYAQTALYLIFSFFTTWLSNPTTWFWYGVTAVVYWLVGSEKKSSFKKKRPVL